MPKDVLISVEHVSKKYCRSLKHSMLYGVYDVARDMFGLEGHSEQLRNTEFWALDDVSFNVKRGECLGIIGPNGAGKSTLLKMLNGILLPDRGKITMRGRVGALIELGAGFHPMLTGRENIYVNGAILGLCKSDIDRKFDEIVAFAELKDFVDSPVKFYSSGMYLRLGFAVAVHLKPDVLLIDEVLAVGDDHFRSKCTHKIAQAISNGAALIFVSHNMNEIIRACDKAMWLQNGRAVENGGAASVTGAYLRHIDRQEILEMGRQDCKTITGARLRDFRMCDREGTPRACFRSGEPMVVHFDYEKEPDIKALTFSFSISLGDEKSYVSCHSPWTGFALNSNNRYGRVTLTIPQLLLNSGHYLVNVGIWDESFKCAYEWRWAFRHIEIFNEDDKFTGRFLLPHQWSETPNRDKPDRLLLFNTSETER
jgi:lipopolysaccharide transport system ATP-binding protein